MKYNALPKMTWFGPEPKNGAIALFVPDNFSIFAASLGIQQVYRLLTAAGLMVDVAWLDRDNNIVTYTGRKISTYQVIGISLSYELEITNLLAALQTAGIPLWREQRTKFDPLLIAGGPLTSINRDLLLNIVDAQMLGGAEDNIADLFCAATGGRDELHDFCLKNDNMVIPETLTTARPKTISCPIPASSVLTSPDSAFPNIFMVEIARGCPSRCAFCSLSALSEKLRFFSMENIISAIPANADRVGLVSAVPTDHPDIVPLLDRLVASGKRVSLSSLRIATLTDHVLDLLVAGGLRSLTIAADGPSERLRKAIHKPVNEAALLRGVTMAKEHKLHSLKVYCIIGLPGETQADLDEFICLIKKMRAIAPQIAITLSLSPFVPKPFTELGGAPICPVGEMQQKLKYLKKALKLDAAIVGDAPKTAHLEYQIATSKALTAQTSSELICL